MSKRAKIETTSGTSFYTGTVHRWRPQKPGEGFRVSWCNATHAEPKNILNKGAGLSVCRRCFPGQEKP